MCENHVSRRALFLAGGAMTAAGIAETVLPKVAFAAPAPQPSNGATPAPADQTRTVTGHFPPNTPDWYYLPVEVPEGVREIEVVYSYDRPTEPADVYGNACDIGMFGPEGYELGNSRGFRGWSGGFRDRFTISAGAATPGYLPGPITPGTWHVILGPYTISPQGLNYRVDITLRFGPADPPFVPNPAPATAPAKARGKSWYRGDCHLHTVYSDGHRTPDELVAAARAAKLDFMVSTEHNTPSAHLQWGQHATPDLLIVNGEEVTTRSGHWPALGLPAGHWIDWRYRADDPKEFRRFVDDVHKVGGIVVAAHPFAACFGCTYEFNYEQADAMEVWNGPWTPDDEQTVTTWDGLLRTGHWIPAVGDSDAHNPNQVVGLPHNVVLADDLTTPKLVEGIKAGRNWLAESADVQLSFTATDGTAKAGIGEKLTTKAGTPITAEVTVSGVPGTTVRLLTQIGLRHSETVPASGTATVRWTTSTRYANWVRAEVRRPGSTTGTADTMVALTNPIFLATQGTKATDD